MAAVLSRSETRKKSHNGKTFGIARVRHHKQFIPPISLNLH